MWSIYLAFVHGYVASEIETKEKMEVLFKSLIISSKVRMTSEIVKKQRSLKKGTLNLVYKEELLFGKSKEPDNVRVFKTQSGNKF